MKQPVIVRVTPDKDLESWKVVREGKREPRAKKLSKSRAVKLAKRLLEKKHVPAILLIHKTRYIVERALQF